MRAPRWGIVPTGRIAEIPGRWGYGMLARLGLAGIAASFVTLGASQALALCSITIAPQNGTTLGKIVANTTRNGVRDAGVATTFTIPATGGAVTQSPAAGFAGAAILLHPPSSFQWLVEVKAGPSCTNSTTVRLVTSSLTFTQSGTFTLSAVSGISGTIPSTLANNSFFTLNFSQGGSNGDAKFYVGTSVTLPGNTTSGGVSWSTMVLVPES